MNDKSSNRFKASNLIFIVARWLLGAAFIYMGLNKALDPVNFLKLVHQYEMVQNYLLLNSIAAVLPWFEVFCGLLLLAGIAVRGTALVLLVMLGGFTWVVVHQATKIMALKAIPFCAVKFDCGCGNGEVFICQKIAENFVLILLSMWVLFRKKHPRPSPITIGNPDPADK